MVRSSALPRRPSSSGVDSARAVRDASLSESRNPRGQRHGENQRQHQHEHKAASPVVTPGRRRQGKRRSCCNLRPGTPRNRRPGQSGEAMHGRGSPQARLPRPRAPAAKSRSRMRVLFSGSRLPVASSEITSRGRVTSARQIATRCCSPWLNAPGRRPSLSPSPQAPARASARARTSASSDNADVIR